MASQVIEVATRPFADQKPGTSGLRKRTDVFLEENYLENFVQAILIAAGKPKFLVVGGDGRYYNTEAIQKIVSMCAANNVARLAATQHGYLSTPAASALIRSLKADGGIVLTASHNPGGAEGDFGIKYNMANGGPAPEFVTEAIYKAASTLTRYKKLIRRPQLDLSHAGTCYVNDMQLDVHNPIDNYLVLMREVFDLKAIKEALFDSSLEKPFRLLADSMHGVMGIYVGRILGEELGVPAESLIRGEPSWDFEGLHPDPNLTYAKDLVDELKKDSAIKMGVAFDGDGDRNMILGEEAFFVTPGDSLAILAANAGHIKYFASKPLKGVARSFPTAPAVDRVAEKAKINCYETPTGWKFFGNLMDSGLISLCGEESFGTGSDHIREKDGLWACLAWLSVIAATGKTVKQLVEEHWEEFGRDYFCRYDFEQCDADKCQRMMKELETQLVASGAGRGRLVGKKFGSQQQYEVLETGNFEYKDPVDGSVSSRQGLFVKLTNGARIIFRLSGTGSTGATVRLYVSDYSREQIFADSRTYLKELLDIAYEISKLPEYTGRTEPTVIT